MQKEMREISCTELAQLEREYPTEIAVIREMLEDVEETCLEQAA